MAMMGSNNWEGPDHGLHLGGPDDEFQQFLDMNGMGNMADGLHFDFTDFQNTNGGHIPQSQSRESIDTTMGGTDNGNMMPRLDNGIQGQMHNVTTSTPLSSIPASLMPPPTPSEAMAEIDAQIQYLQQQRIQQAQRHMEEQQAAFFVRQQQQSRMVPPTPQSLELQAGTQFYSPHDQNRQAMYDRYSQLKEQHQELSFTPLVSPAVTPLESQFAIDTQFTVPGAYFSPLTSPALHAQNDANAGFDQRLSSTNSPVDMELESLPGPAAPTSGEVVKKLRKSTTTKTRKSTVKSSPITKAQRRKTLTTPIMKSQQALNQVVEDLESRDQQMSQLPPPAPQPSHATAFGGTTDSENGSVSPQNLSDMPPPPVPKSKSARPSPYMGPQNGAAAHNLATLPGHPSPATPASLMKLPSPKANKSSSRATSQEPAPNEHIEMFELPESVNSTFQKPNPRPIETRSQTQSPALSPMSTKTPGAHPALSPATFAKPPAPGSATASPQLTPGPPSGSLRKTPQMLPRGSKKRGSINSVHVSPALRPKISPNIKPLLPGGTTAEDTASLLLASKSNYQNILEGNNVPGVSYPSELSTNLTSKRTSHKIAEQGRRNRINSALQEIATLLPAVPPKDSEGEGSDGKKEGKNGANSVPNSKASTVELAIEYIKQLKQEIEEANKRAEEAEKKLAMQA